MKGRRAIDKSTAQKEIKQSCKVIKEKLSNVKKIDIEDLGGLKLLSNLVNEMSISHVEELYSNNRAFFKVFEIITPLIADIPLLSEEQLVKAIITGIVDLSEAKRGFLILKSREGNWIKESVHMTKKDIPSTEYRISRTIAERVLSSGEPIVTRSASEEPSLKDIPSVSKLKLRSLICIPLKAEGVLGVFYLDNPYYEGMFTENDLKILTLFSGLAASIIKNSRAYFKMREDSKEEIKLKYDYKNIICTSDCMREVLGLLDKATDSDISVLIQGESGTGKELMAKVLHYNGKRQNSPWIAVNCSAISPSLMGSELFGHVKGAFTNAHYDKKGLFEQANGGTLFLDEIGDMDLGLQAKLLRVLEDDKVRPLGSEKEIDIDVRIISATNKNLKKMVDKEKFRSDLYYRLTGMTIFIPPLRERRDDIPILIEHFFEKHNKRLKFTKSAMRTLLQYNWFGNVRELENEIKRLAVIKKDGEQVPLNEILPEMREEVEMFQTICPLPEMIEKFEKRFILHTIDKCQGNRSKTAQVLGIGRKTLYNKLNRYKIKIRDMER